MRAVVIGSGRGFGAEICTALRRRGVEVVGVSRTRTKGVDFVCNAFDHSMLTSVLAQVLYHRGRVDALFCVAGHVNPKPSSELRPQDWDAAWRMNFGYAPIAWQSLRSSLEQSKLAVLATIGSHWSVNTGCDMLAPYIVTKHALRAYTRELAASHPWLAANHYCVPTMQTPRYRQLIEDSQGEIFSHTNPASPRRVAQCVVKNALARQSGQTYMIEPDDTVWIRT